MKGVLLHILLTVNGGIEATNVGSFESMEDCFWARDYYSVERGGDNGFYPPSEQAICIASNVIE